MILKVRLKQILRLIKQLNAKNNDVAIIGGYHGANLGDMALGKAVYDILKEQNRKSYLQTIYTLDKYPWKKTKYAFLGGGAIGYTPSLVKILERYTEEEFSNIAFLGVDFNESYYEEKIINLLKKCSIISCRNEVQASKLSELTGRDDISFHPDLAFSLNRHYCKSKRLSKSELPLFLVNLAPLYCTIKEGKIEPVPDYKKERPELYENFHTMIESYEEGIRRLVKNALNDGYQVATIPFTPQDAIISKLLLRDLDVKHNNYSDDVDEMFDLMSQASLVYATRYHATIFALKLGVPLIPMAYARKNEHLLKEIFGKSCEFITAQLLGEGKTDFPEPLIPDSNVVEQWENKATTAIKSTIRKFGLDEN